MIAGPRVDLRSRDPARSRTSAELLGDRVTVRDAEALVLGVPTDGSAADVRALLDEVDPTATRSPRSRSTTRRSTTSSSH